MGKFTQWFSGSFGKREPDGTDKNSGDTFLDDAGAHNHKHNQDAVRDPAQRSRKINGSKETDSTGRKNILSSIGGFFALLGHRISSLSAHFAGSVKKLFARSEASDESGKQTNGALGEQEDREYIPVKSNHTASPLQEEQPTTVFTGTEALKSAESAADKPNRHPDRPDLPPSQLRGKGKAAVSLFKPRDSRPPFILGVVLTTVKVAAIALVIVAAAGVGAVFGVANAYLGTTPNLDLQQISDQSLTSYIYDGNDNLITSYAGMENRDYAALDEIPKLLQEAVIATEDVRFYYHNGVDLKGLTSAFLGTLSGGKTRGGSTITQQLIKNQLLSSERSYKRKIQEASLALQLEEKYSKDQILEAYLNTIHLGGTNYGVKAAAMDYFGKELNDLTLRETACIAGITQYPYLYNPRTAYYKNTKNKQALNNRISDVLKKMYSAGYITKEEMEEAQNDTFTVIEESAATEMYDMPHFTEYAVYDVVTHMLRKEGLEDNSQNRSAMENELRTGGYQIYTTVDPSMQNTLQTTVSEYDSYPRLADKNDAVKTTTNSDGTVTEVIQPQASAVIVDQSTGYIKALVGSRDTPTSKKTLNRAYQARMSIGSSIKPLTVYGPMFEKGYGLATSVADLPVPIDGWNTPAGHPLTSTSNAGWVSVRRGIKSSLNIVAARAIMDYTTLDTAYEYLGKLGISYERVSKSGVGLALGTSGISSLEMAGAYACIANGGTYVEPVAFRYVLDSSGNNYLKCEEYQDTHEVFKKSSAYMLVSALTDAVKNGTGTRARIKGITVAGKTGTNQKAKGVFFAGMTGYYVSTLWVGHDDDKALRKGTVGGNGAAPLWQKYMSIILEGKEDKPILEGSAEDYGVVKASICALSCMKATGACSADEMHKPVTDYMPADSPFLKDSCDWHTTSGICEESGMLPSEYCPIVESGGVVNIPDNSPYAKWSAADLRTYIPNRIGSSAVCTLHTAEWAAQQEVIQAAADDANGAIAEANALIASSGDQMTASQLSRLRKLISAAESAIIAEEPDADKISRAAAKLRDATSEIRTAIQNAQPTPTPIPEPEPEPEPDDGGDNNV